MYFVLVINDRVLRVDRGSALATEDTSVLVQEYRAAEKKSSQLWGAGVSGAVAYSRLHVNYKSQIALLRVATETASADTEHYEVNSKPGYRCRSRFTSYTQSGCCCGH